MNYAEQIAAFEAKRAAAVAAMVAIMTKSGEEGSTLDAAEQEEYDGHEADIAAIDGHLKRLRTMEGIAKASAKPVSGENENDGGRSRIVGSGIVVANKKLAPGTAFARYVGAMASARGNRTEAAEFAKRWKESTPEVENILRMPVDVIEKTAVSAGTTTDTTWASPLVQYQDMAAEFIEFLRPQTVIGKINGFRRVPFKVRVPRQTGGATVNWVGESKVKPLTSLAFDSVTLDFAKVAGIIPLSEELVRFSSPAADELVRADLASAIAQFLDHDFLDSSKASNDVSPASITYGVSGVTATGTTAAAFRLDVKTMLGNFLTSNIDVTTGHWIMTPTQALALSLMQNALGQPEFPGITMAGGKLLGFPVVTTTNLVATTGSPTDGYPIIFAVAGEIMLADDGAVNIDMSREASLQMETAPDSPATASTTLVSLWQHNMIAIKAERYMRWVARRSGAVGMIVQANYSE